MLRALVALALSAVAWCQAEPEERSIGPLAVGDRTFQVTLSVTGIRIKDADGVVHFEKKIAEKTAVQIAVLNGRNGAGLLLTYEATPSVPRARSWEVLGIIDGKLKSFGPPIFPDGSLAGGVPSWDAALLADVLNFRISAGNFFVIVPVEVSWEHGIVRLAYGLVRRCRMAVEATRKPAETAASIQLFPGTDEKAGDPVEVEVKKGSVVEFLEAEGRILWEESEDRTSLGVAEDIWLRVRIDGKEGYLHSPEDFEAVGLPDAG
jgi:hypothetical protein